MIEPPPDRPEENAIEFEVRIPSSGEVNLVPDRQRFSLPRALASRTVTVWADLRSLHILLDGHLVRTVVSRLLPQDLAYLVMRYGARPVGPAPAAPAPRHIGGNPVLGAGQAVEVERKAQRDGHVTIAGVKCQIAFALARRTITLRLDGHLMHATADGALVGTWPCPITAERAARLPGARTAATPLPPPPLPAGLIRVQRRVHASGRFMVNGQFIKLGPRHAGKLVTVVVEDTITGSCTVRKNSPSGPAATPHPSPGSTSEARASSPADVKNVWVMQGCGLRIGEAFALNTKCRVGDGQTLRITEQVNPTAQLRSLKFRKAGEYRDIPLPRYVSGAIDKHLADHGASQDGYLFRGRKKKLVTRNTYREHFTTAVKDAGLPDGFVPHSLRHYYASLALSRGIPITDVSRWLGHKSIEVT
ncbi:site-specific integrase [Actinoallomurus sp. NPDC050550]|uniref:tyrosine-type recombinase/integrase n=1 Tax=Actinoallomurus sp. NPDC050550 TaxID=3154937 RepID=UPI003409992B